MSLGNDRWARREAQGSFSFRLLEEKKALAGDPLRRAFTEKSGLQR